ncbi:MAG: hypothetical protein ACFE75_01320 [Candidatus Hodarchaeota archaeon]
MVNDFSDFRLFQRGTGIETSINSLITELSRISEEKDIKMLNVRHVKERKDEITHNFVDNSKAKELLGFEVRYGLNEGLKHTIGWFLNN